MLQEILFIYLWNISNRTTNPVYKFPPPFFSSLQTWNFDYLCGYLKYSLEFASEQKKKVANDSFMLGVNNARAKNFFWKFVGFYDKILLVLEPLERHARYLYRDELNAYFKEWKIISSKFSVPKKLKNTCTNFNGWERRYNFFHYNECCPISFDGCFRKVLWINMTMFGDYMNLFIISYK